MECQYCGGHCTIYDGGEANDYEMAVYVCDECGEWQDEETDEDDDEPATWDDRWLNGPYSCFTDNDGT